MGMWPAERIRTSLLAGISAEKRSGIGFPFRAVVFHPDNTTASPTVACPNRIFVREGGSFSSGEKQLRVGEPAVFKPSRSRLANSCDKGAT